MAKLHQAVKANDVAAVEELLRLSDDPLQLANETNSSGSTPLCLAVENPNVDPRIVDLLLDAGADYRFVREGRVLPEPILQIALKNAPLAVIRSLHGHGADFLYQDSNGYTALLDAIHSPHDRLDVVRFLIDLGVDINATSVYNETALKSTYMRGYFPIVAELLKAGAEDFVLHWTPLIQAAAIGTAVDVRDELALAKSLDGRDVCGRTALHVALHRGDLPITMLLLEAGMSLSEPLSNDTAPLCLAVESGNIALVQHLVELGCSVEALNLVDDSCLAIAVQRKDHAMVKVLLDLGADPNAGKMFNRAIEKVEDRETILLLAENGANLDNLNDMGRHLLIGLEDEVGSLDEITREQYMAHRYPREGAVNPEEMTNPFWLAMLRDGRDAYSARMRFADEPTFSCSVGGQREPAVWCFARFGQSTTLLPDGRVIFIAGEHEDSYDPDFYIYNDVTVVEPDGVIRIFGYPYSVFPPTDFHSATLVGDYIYIIGSLGYQERRNEPLPIYRLDTRDYHIEVLPTSGTGPGRLYEHQSKLIDEETIRVWGGKTLDRKSFKERFADNQETFELNLRTGVWTTI